jgi:hypothetical protein
MQHYRWKDTSRILLDDCYISYDVANGALLKQEQSLEDRITKTLKPKRSLYYAEVLQI